MWYGIHSLNMQLSLATVACFKCFIALSAVLMAAASPGEYFLRIRKDLDAQVRSLSS